VKYILVIGDGMADNPVPELGGKTPVEYARTPVMDYLAAHGELGSVYNIPEGLPPGSDTAILSIFGCDPRTCYTGRAPLEAAAKGIELSPGDVAYRCNMVSIEDGDMPFEEKRILSHNAGSIEGDISDQLINELFNDPEFRAAALEAGLSVSPGHSFRHIAVQKQVDVNGLVLAGPHDHLGERVGPLLPRGCENAEVLKRLMVLAHRLLDRHPVNIKRRAEGRLPANGIWFWAEGTAVKLPNFVENYGKRGGVVSAVPLCQGIAALTGLEVVTVEGATGELDTNYEGKVEAAVELLRKGADFAAVHVEAPDECTHNGDTKGKILAIEYIDGRILGPLVEKLEKEDFEFRLLFLSDHKTLTSTRGHDDGPVPYVIYDSRKKDGSGLNYSEANGLKGPVVKAGTELMSILFEQAK